MNQNKDRHIFKDKNEDKNKKNFYPENDKVYISKKSKYLSIDNSQSISSYKDKPHLSKIVKFKDIINKENMTQIL